MLNLANKSLPNTIKIGGKDFSIYTDFRVWLRFSQLQKNGAFRKGTDISFIFKNEMPAHCDVREIFAFSNPEAVLPRQVKSVDDKSITLDFEIDGDYIYASFLEQYGIDLIDIEYLHWHKFIALLRGTQGTYLAEIMKYRNYRKETRKNVDFNQELRDAWEIIPELSEEEKMELEEFSKQFGGVTYE